MSSDVTDAPSRLTRERVLGAALDLVDSEGLGALTMRSLADRLGVVPMALYRHVRNKEDLIDGVLDLATAQVVMPERDLDWRAGLEALARSVRATMLAHPAVAARVIDRPSLGPASVRIGEYGMGVLREAGFDDATAEHGLNLVVVYTLGFVALEVPRLGGSGTDRNDDAMTSAYAALPADEFPHTTAIAPRPHAIVSEHQFAFGLECVLDGIAARSPSR